MPKYSNENSHLIPPFASLKTLPAFAWHFSRKQILGLLLITFFMFGWTLKLIGVPYVLKLIINEITGGSGQEENGLIYTLCFAALILTLIQIGFRLVDWLEMKVYPSFRANIRMNMFAYLLHHSHQYFIEKMSGSIADKMTRLPQSMENIIRIITGTFIPVIVAFIIAEILLWNVHPLFAIICFTWMVIHLGILVYFAKKCDYYSKKHAESLSQLNGKMVDVLFNISNVRLFSSQKLEDKYVGNFQSKEKVKARLNMKYILKVKLAFEFFALIMFFAIIGLLIYGFNHRWVTAGDFALIVPLTNNLIGLTWYMSLHLITFFEEIGFCRQALGLITPYEIKDASEALPLKVTNGAIDFKNVDFNYHATQKLIENFTIRIEGKTKVGIVGLSGGGKSTFINLILRLYDVKKGHISIDGQNIKSVTQESLRRNIAVIPQDIMLFHRTIRENICYGIPEASDLDVQNAAKKAFCHDFIMKLEKQYDTDVGEKGIKLSAGQRQRILIARAFLKNSPIFILDEATSFLDSITERKIQVNIEDNLKGRTVIIIAHRLSTLLKMDQILVFKDGSIVGCGSHTELLQTNNHYRNLWQESSLLEDLTEAA